MNSAQYLELKRMILALQKAFTGIVGGGVGAHAASHSDGGSDEVSVLDLGGFPGGSTDFLREDGTFATPSVGSIGDLFDWFFVRKTGDESVSSATTGTTLQNDAELLFPVAANEVWVFEFIVFAYGDTAADIKFGITAPSGASKLWDNSGLSGGTTGHSGNLVSWAVTADAGGGGFGTQGTTAADMALYRITGIVRNGANAGNLQLQWAQNASNASPTVVVTDSYLIARRVA